MAYYRDNFYLFKVWRAFEDVSDKAFAWWICNRYETKMGGGKTAEEEKLKENRSHKIKWKIVKENFGFQRFNHLLVSEGRGSVVGIATVYGLDDRGAEVRVPVR
jgi:hypothetical protein